MRALSLTSLFSVTLFLTSCIPAENATKTSPLQFPPQLAEFVLAPYFIALFGIALALWVCVQLIALVIRFVPSARLDGVREQYPTWRRTATHVVAILFAVSTLGFSIGYIAGNSRESIIGSIVTAAIAALGGVAAYWFSKEGDSKTLSAISVVLFTVTIIYGTQVGARWRVEYEIWQETFEINIEAQKAKVMADVDSQKFSYQSQVANGDKYYQMQLNAEEHRLKTLIDLEAKLESPSEDALSAISKMPLRSTDIAATSTSTLTVSDEDTTALDTLIGLAAQARCGILCTPIATPPPTPSSSTRIN